MRRAKEVMEGRNVGQRITYLSPMPRSSRVCCLQWLDQQICTLTTAFQLDKLRANPISLSSSIPGSDQDKLCMKCSQLNFLDTLLPPPFLVTVLRGFDKAIFQTRNLGEIVGNDHCPFCKLVVRGLTSGWNFPINELKRSSTISMDCTSTEGDEILHIERSLDEVTVEYSYIVFGEYHSLEKGESKAVNSVKLQAEAFVLNSTKAIPPIKIQGEIPEKAGIKAVNRIKVQACIHEKDRNFSRHLCEADIQIMALHAPLKGEEEITLRGRRMTDMVDLKIVEDWIEKCNAHEHRGLSDLTLQDERWPSRLIDVEQERVVQAKMPCRYATLSYVWGSSANDQPEVPQLKLTEDNLDRLTSIGGLSDSHTDIPQTIKDAILLCKRLSIPYLWVDALCIQQDLARKMEEVAAMDKIYHFSYLTIVSASGKDSWAGLAGLRSQSRNVHSDVSIVDGVPMGIC
jgi:hypothetical protein